VTALAQAVADQGYWYHRIALPGDVVTPGFAPLYAPHYRLPEDLRGARVLDVGAWDGYWTWECLHRGADRVVAIDDFSDHVGDLKHAGEPWATWDLCAAAFGYESRCERHTLNVYNLGKQFGTFDLVLFFGTLYHCRYPMLALDRLAAAAPRGDILVESAVTDQFGCYNSDGYGECCVAEFYPRDEYASNPTNWWGPTLSAIEAMVTAAGWVRVSGHRIDVPDEAVKDAAFLPYLRGYVQGYR